MVSWWKPELEPLMFTVTAFSRGSTHLADLCCLSVGPVDWPELTASELLKMVELGGLVEDRLRRLGVPPRGDDGAVINYFEPLHPTYVIFLLEQELPLQYLFQDTQLVLMKRLALFEEERRGYDFSLDNYLVSESPALQQAWRELAPDTPLPDKDIEFERLLSRVGGIFLKEDWDETTAENQGRLYAFLHKLADVGFDEELTSHTSGALKQVSQLQEASLSGKLRSYLSTVAYHDRMDEIRRDRKEDATVVRTDEAGEGVHSETDASGGDPLHTKTYRQWIRQGRPEPEFDDDQPAILDDLSLPLDQLTPGERNILGEVIEAEELGFSRSSKQGKSLKDYWGPDYGRKSKRLERATAKLRVALPNMKRGRQHKK
jgi:hypothetical protein